MKNFVAQTKTRTIYAANVSAIMIHIFSLTLGFIVSRGVIFEQFTPFGLVFSGGCSYLLLPATATGAFIGYFFSAAGSGGFKYIASLLAIVSVRLILSNGKKLFENPYFLGGITVLSNIITSAVTYSGVPLDLIKIAVENIIVFSAILIIAPTYTELTKENVGFSTDTLMHLAVFATIIVLGLIDTYIFGFSLGRMLGVFLILAAGRYSDSVISCVCGILISFACALSSFDNVVVIYAFMGLAVAMFSSLGKYAIAASGIAIGVIGISIMQFKSGSIQILSEILVVAFLFLLIPRSFGIYLSKYLRPVPVITKHNGFSKEISMRLHFASQALIDVADTVSQVSEELTKINSPDFKTVLGFIEQDACAGCKLRLHCWENKSAATLDAVMQMINCVKGAETTPQLTTLDEFKGRCLRYNKMQNAVKYRYSQYSSLVAAENRIDEVRQVVSEQFEGISVMLDELSEEITGEERFSARAANACIGALKSIGINADECSAKINKYGRMSLEIKIKTDKQTVLNRLQIMKLLSVCCERDFDIPSITKLGNYAVITATEHTNFKIDIGIEQHCATPGSICGDAYKYFNDGKGHFIMILSDGMGTGGRAAVDGAMASGLMARLLKAGFGYDCSLKILNSSMLFKSSDESLATMDIASIDLFNGTTELYKAGAAPTIVRRNGHAGRAESNSLPVGILKDVTFDRAGIRLKDKDILLLLSDGATFDGTEWLRRELEAWGDGCAQDLAEHICDCAKRRYLDTRPDDITVMAAIVERSS